MSLFGIFNIQVSDTTAQTPAVQDERKPVSENMASLFIKAKAKVYHCTEGKSKKEAKELAKRDVFSQYRIMSEKEEAARRDSLYQSMQQANNRSGHPALTDAEIYDIAYKGDVSAIPQHRIDNTKKEKATGRKIDKQWWENVAKTGN